MSDGGRSMRAVVAMFLLVLANGGAAVAAPKCSFESVVRFAEAEFVQGEILPARFAKSLGFPDADLSVKRLPYTQQPTDIYRAVDIIPGTADLVLFIRKGKDIVIFWRVSSAGKIITTVAATPDWLRRQDNATYAADYAAVHDFFCDRIEEAKQKASPGR